MCQDEGANVGLESDKEEDAADGAANSRKVKFNIYSVKHRSNYSNLYCQQLNLIIIDLIFPFCFLFIWNFCSVNNYRHYSVRQPNDKRKLWYKIYWDTESIYIC